MKLQPLKVDTTQFEIMDMFHGLPDDLLAKMDLEVTSWMHECEFCLKAYPKYTELRRHLKNEHINVFLSLGGYPKALETTYFSV